MKTIGFLLLLMVVTILAESQNVQLHYDFGKNRHYLTSTIEKYTPDQYGSTFFFVDFNYDKNGPTSAYWEISRELKSGKTPFSIHLEYNGGLNTALQFNNAYLFGGSCSWNGVDFKKGISFTAMYKLIQGNEQPHNFQLTAVWYLLLFNDKISLTGFADFWQEKHVVSADGFVADFKDASFTFLSEPQLWYRLNKTFSVGSEVELSYNFAGVARFNVCPTLAMKYNF